MKTPFLGPAYRSRSPNLADQRLINLYPEIVETKTGKEVGAFYSCPGLVQVATVGAGPIQAMHAFEGQTLYVVSGNQVYALDTSLEARSVGSITVSTSPISIIDNGVQVAIFQNPNAYSIVGGDLAPIALPFTNPGIAVYQDGFGVVNEVGSINLWQSNSFDLTTWDPLNFDTADGSSDYIVALGELHRQIVVLKQDHAEFWINAGNPGFVFQRLDGVHLNVGCVAPGSLANLGENLLWLGRNADGNNIVHLLNGYEPRDMSTHALVREFNSYPTTTDAIGFAYQQERHLFYALTFPSGNATWVLDLTASQQLGVPCWHQRAGFSNGQFNRYAGQCAVNFAGQILVGDFASGNLYSLDLDNFQDNGQTRKWLRSWRALPKPTLRSTKYHWLAIDLETGIDVPDGANPQIVLRYSDDGGHNWSNERQTSAGLTGQTDLRVKFNRLGMSRRGPSDRIFELSGTDPFKVALLSAEFG